MVAIGSVELDNPVVLAPMAGVTDIVYRSICRRMGAGLVCCEMVSAAGLVHNNVRTRALLQTAGDEHPVSMQLFGSQPASLARAAAAAQQEGADIIDLNAGCPTLKIVRNGAGAALLRDVAGLEAILCDIVEHTDLPVTVKLRAGWNSKSINVVEVAKRAEQCGVAAVCIHPRTREQMFHGSADWRLIAEVVEAVAIPVIGSGDVRTPQDGLRMMDETGCAAVMIGRAALGNPWILARTASYIRTGELVPEPSLTERLDVLELHLRAAVAQYGEQRATRMMRKHAAWYLRGIPNAASIRNHVFGATTLAQYINIIEDMRLRSDATCGVCSSCG